MVRKTHRHLSDDERALVLNAWEGGVTQADIALSHGVGIRTVQRICTGDAGATGVRRSGRPRILSKTQGASLRKIADALLEDDHLKDRFNTKHVLARSKIQCKLRISLRTHQRTMLRIGLKRVRATAHPTLNAQDRADRAAHAEVGKNWDADFLRRLWFVDGKQVPQRF
jgi:transposase